ncbi:MAG: TIGR02710 family CRISPR-associated protein [Thermoplasmata archaeon]|nr:MAG: TIGR02710 family CRISPR-associated protein [Thermoplasmata archaeon]
MKVLFMTVGTGIGKDEGIKSLAHGLAFAIRRHSPDRVVFFGSEKSKQTIEEIKEQYREMEGKELKDDMYEFVQIGNIDSFRDCYEAMEKKVKDYERDEIIVDYTSGTKTMTTSAAIVAMLYQKPLYVTSGKRGENGLVIPGTEEVKQQNLYSAYDKFSLDKAKEAFNSYRFEDARNYLKCIVALEEKRDLLMLVDAYELWDRFNHREAWKILKEVKLREEGINRNKEFLGRLNKAVDEGKDVREFLIPDLLNNAGRRLEEGKYDDAVARLYRCLEMMMQYVLWRDYQIDSSDVDTWKLRILNLEDKVVDAIEKKRGDDGKIRLGLMDDIELLHYLGNDLGKIKDDGEIRDLLRRRNYSILAHGNEPVDEKTARRFYGRVKEIAGRVVDDLDRMMELSRFPKL